MRYGSSGNLTATQPDKTGIETIEKLKKFGYDYIELPLSEIMDLPPEQRVCFFVLYREQQAFKDYYKKRLMGLHPLQQPEQFGV